MSFELIRYPAGAVAGAALFGVACARMSRGFDGRLRHAMQRIIATTLSPERDRSDRAVATEPLLSTRWTRRSSSPPVRFAPDAASARRMEPRDCASAVSAMAYPARSPQ